MTKKLQTLLLCTRPASMARTVVDHIDALSRLSRHDVFCVPQVRALSNRLPKPLDLAGFDAIVIHYSIYIISEDYLGPAAKQRIADFRGLKVLFLQDEYRQIDCVIETIRRLGIHLLFTCVPQNEIDKVYPAERLPGVIKINNLTGYVPADLVRRETRPIAARPIDVGYRSRMVPFWLGALGAEKWQIAPRFLEATAGSGLVCDLSYRENDRIYGEKWIRYIASCKALLGTESGASVFDFSGEIQHGVEAFLARHPEASFEQVQEKFFRGEEGKISLNQISPRCFEAAALRTAMILYEGEYSGILRPWRHYVPLKKDMSNIEEVVRFAKDPVALQRIADCAYEEVAKNPAYSYREFVARFDDELDNAATSLRTARTARPVSLVTRLRVSARLLVPLYILRVWLSIPEASRQKLKWHLGAPLRALKHWVREI